MNLNRFEARFIEPVESVRAVVDTYWAVRWHLPPGESVVQRIIDFPAITLSVESGDVPAPFVISAVRPGAWSRVIRGHGSVFALRLRPAGLSVLSDVPVQSLSGEGAVTGEHDRRAHDLLQAISSAESVTGRAVLADKLILDLLHERPLGRAQTIANAAVDVLTRSPRVRPGRVVAAELGTSERTLQRALRSTVGVAPNDVARRIRLQEVVRRLSLPHADASETAAELGYVDQAHLINEFRSVTGTTPGQYIRSLGRAAGVPGTSS